MKKLYFLSQFLLLTILASAQITAISLENFATGFDRPVDITHCGDERMFIVEQDGTIKIINADGSVEPTPFLDIDSKVNSSGNEQGLLGLAFHPDYLTNGFFYVYYTKNNGGDTRVARYSVDAADPNVADPDSELTLLEADQPYTNHNGGAIKFGPDGYLYISLGDGGSGGDPQNNGQTRQTFLGKMLRIDVDNGDPYSIPADNPFANDDETLDEIWALGLRNSWRISFDRVTGDLWMGDVGQNEWEEIDFQPASSMGGENYGWRCYEGNHTYNTNNCVPMSELTFPVVEYSNSFVEGCSVTGGFVYRGCEFPVMYGHYVFADYCSGKFWRVTPDGTGGWVNDQVADLANFQFSAFGENAEGQLFVAGLDNGNISKVVPTGELLAATDETCIATSDGTVIFSIPTDQFATVSWADGSDVPNRTDLNPGIYEVTVTTTNGCEFSGSAEVNPGPGLGIPLSVTVENDSLLSIPDVGANGYQWQLNGEPISGAFGTSYTAQENGLYSVFAVFGDDCNFTSDEVEVMVVSSATESLGLTSFSLSPNPFGETLTLQFSASQNIDFEVVVTNLAGQEFLREQNNTNGGFAKTFDLSDLPSGIYLFKMKTAKGEWSERVVKR